MKSQEAETRTSLPAITERTGVRTNLLTLCTVGGALVSSAIWCTCMYMDVQTLKKSDEDKAKAILAITDKLNSVDNDVKHIRWILDPTASKPVLISPTHSNTTANTP